MTKAKGPVPMTAQENSKKTNTAAGGEGRAGVEA